MHVYKHKTEQPYHDVVDHIKNEAIEAIKRGELVLPAVQVARGMRNL